MIRRLARVVSNITMEHCEGRVCPCPRALNSPSPTRNWYSGPVGFEMVLLVSIIGVIVVFPTAAYCDCVGYALGGGGKTLVNEGMDIPISHELSQCPRNALNHVWAQ